MSGRRSDTAVEHRCESRAGDEDAAAEYQRGYLAASDALVRRGTRDAEQLGNLGDGIGESILHVSLLIGRVITREAKRLAETRRGGERQASRRDCAEIRAVLCAVARADIRHESAGDCSGCQNPGVARTWLSITVELVEGGSRSFWPRPGRVLAAARTHTFGELADAIDDAFARWDRSHLHEFRLVDDTRIGQPDHDWADEPCLDDRRVKLSRLSPGEKFFYVFDFGDCWHHLCTVAEQRIDPLHTLGIVPPAPLPYWGWGDLPDQYGRRWMSDDCESPIPPNPHRTDLPPFLPWWGPGAERYPD